MEEEQLAPESKAQAPAAKRSDKATSINGVFRPLLIGVLLVGLVVAAVTYVLQSSGLSSASQRQAELVANEMSNRLANLAAGYQRFVAALALDSQVSVQLEAKDFAALDAHADFLARSDSEVLKVRFLPKDHADTDNDPVIPLSFSSLDLANRAQRKARVQAVELHAPASPAQHIALAAPIKSTDGRMLGAVHVALSPQPLLTMIQQVSNEGIGVRLVQVSGGKTLELARAATFSDAADASSLKIDNSIWQLDFHALGGAGFLQLYLAPIITLVGMAVIAVLLIMMQGKLRKALQMDQDSLTRIIERKFAGKVDNVLGNYALEDNKEMISYLSQLGVSASASKPARATAGAIKAVTDDTAATPAFPSQVSQTETTATNVEDIEGAEISAEIFREYDIRGVVGDSLNLEQAYVIGRAIGSLAVEQGESAMLVARDGRVSSKDLSSTLVRGLSEAGIDVTDLGMVPTPVLYYGTHNLPANSGVMVTGSHNPPDYNGFKVVIGGEALSGEAIQGLYQRITAGQFTAGDGAREQQDISADYIRRISDDVQLLKPMKVVLDCGHGVASVLARPLFEALGCEVVTLYCEVDGKFPAHHPDPGDPANMQELAKAVKEENADLGIAFDGDGDRLGVVDSAGDMIMPDRVLMLLSADLLLRNPGADIVYDVKSSKHLAAHVLSSGGRPIMWKSGHSLMKAKIRETGALLGGEFSGHFFFTERWYGFDDALYAGARLLEVISGDGRYSSEVFAELPDSVNTPELKMTVTEGVQHEIMKRLAEAPEKAFPNAKIVDIDGIRAEYPGAWGLVRASNTTPALVFRFEADNGEAMGKVQDIFRTVFKTILPNANIPF